MFFLNRRNWNLHSHNKNKVHPLLSGIRILKNEEALSVSSDLVTFFFFFSSAALRIRLFNQGARVCEGNRRRSTFGCRIGGEQPVMQFDYLCFCRITWCLQRGSWWIPATTSLS